MNILIVDDHPMVTSFYETIVLHSFSNGSLPNTVKAFNCEQAYNAITSAEGEMKFGLAILDYRLPAYKAGNIFDGCDLAKLVREKSPGCKIVVITAQTEVLVVYDIMKKIHPEGLAVKNDIDTDSFTELVLTVLDGGLYQSSTVKSCTAQIWKNEIMIDDDNRKIIFHLAKGYKVKQLESVIDLSSSTIQKRIINIKKKLGLPADHALVFELNRRGYL